MRGMRCEGVEFAGLGAGCGRYRSDPAGGEGKRWADVLSSSTPYFPLAFVHRTRPMEGERGSAARAGWAYRLSGGKLQNNEAEAGRGNNVRDNRPDNVPENGRLDKRVE